MSRNAGMSERFWEKVDRSGGPSACWLWLAATDKDGYGKFWFGDNSIAASRAAWILERGAVPHGAEVLHNCPSGDNPMCVNPDHLFLGSKRDNVADRDRKGNTARGDRHGRRVHPEAYAHLVGEAWCGVHQNQAKGERHGSAKIDWDRVRTIRREYLASNGGVNQRMLGERYGLDQSTVSEILLNKIWAEPGGAVRAQVVEFKQRRTAAILADFAAGMSRADICAKHGVGRQIVSDALRGPRSAS